MSMVDIQIEQVIELVVQNNALLNAFFECPGFDRSNPAAAPKPLFFSADFVRRTYFEYLLPLLPKEAHVRSAKVAQPNIIKYNTADTPRLPTGDDGDEWLHDAQNWPDRRTKKYRETFQDAFSRTFMMSMCINDPAKGALILGGRYDWPENVQEIARDITARA